MDSILIVLFLGLDAVASRDKIYTGGKSKVLFHYDGALYARIIEGSRNKQVQEDMGFNFDEHEPSEASPRKNIKNIVRLHNFAEVSATPSINILCEPKLRSPESVLLILPLLIENVQVSTLLVAINCDVNDPNQSQATY